MSRLVWNLTLDLLGIIIETHKDNVGTKAAGGTIGLKCVPRHGGKSVFNELNGKSAILELTLVSPDDLEWLLLCATMTASLFIFLDCNINHVM